MVLAVPAPTGVRYRLLETLRQFAADRLAEQPDATEVQDRHAAYWRDRAVTLGRATGGTDQQRGARRDRCRYRQLPQRVRLPVVDRPGQRRRPRGAGPRHVLADSPHPRRAALVSATPHPPRPRRAPATPRARRRRAGRSHVGDVYAGERYATEAVQLAEAAGVDPPWGAFEALMIVAMWRQDPAAYRQWWEHGHQVAMASGQRYLQLLIEAQRGAVPRRLGRRRADRTPRTTPTRDPRHGDPLLMFVSANAFAIVLHHAGQTERARDDGAVGDRTRPARRAHHAHCPPSNDAAALDALSGDTDYAHAGHRRRGSAHRPRRRPHPPCAPYACSSPPPSPPNATTSKPRPCSSPPPPATPTPSASAATPPAHACRVEAQTAVDAYPGDLTAAQRRGEAMTLDDLITYTLDILE